MSVLINNLYIVLAKAIGSMIVEVVWTTFVIQKYSKVCFPRCRDLLLFIAVY